MTQTPSRRAVARSALWAVPAVTVAVAVPAFAATSPVAACSPAGLKLPGEGQNTKDYTLAPNCLGGEVTSVTINGLPAWPEGPLWALRGQPDSGSRLPVTVTFADGSTWSGVVQFLPPSTQ